MHGVEGSAAPGLNRPESDFIHHFSDRDHIFSPATGCEQRLVTITQSDIHHFHRVAAAGRSLSYVISAILS